MLIDLNHNRLIIVSQYLFLNSKMVSKEFLEEEWKSQKENNEEDEKTDDGKSAK